VPPTSPDERFNHWISRLEERHFADLTFQEVSRSLRALSSTYVERRNRLDAGAALSGKGKRAAFALFYAPLHFLLVREIAQRMPHPPSGSTIVDLGCGTGAAGAAWASSVGATRILGIDCHPWTLDEAARTYRDFGLAGRTQKADVATVTLPKPPASFLAAFTMNELAEPERNALFERLLARQSAVLVVEPLAGFVAPWWNRWAEVFEKAGGRTDTWRLSVPLPDIVAKLDRASGLNHRELTGRSLWIGEQRA